MEERSTTEKTRQAKVKVRSGFCTSSLVFGILSMVCFCQGQVAFTLGVTAIVCGILGFQRNDPSRRSRAKWGIGLAALPTLFWLPGFICWVYNYKCSFYSL